MRSPAEFDGIYLFRTAVDLRKQSRGLAVLVENEMRLNPFEKKLFVFTNKRRNFVKSLYWRGTGFALWAFRLDKNRFFWPKAGETTITLSPEQLTWLLDGVDLAKIRPHQKLSYQRTC